MERSIPPQLTSSRTSNLLKTFRELETEGDLFQCRVDGLPLWWFVRLKLFWLLEKQLTGIDYLSKTTAYLPLMDRLRKIMDSLASLHRVRLLDGPAPLLVLSTAAARRHRTEDGRDFDVFFDFLSYTKYSQYVVAEFPDRTPHSRKPYSKDVIYADMISFLGNVGRAMASYRTFGKQVDQLCQRTIGLLGKYGLNVAPETVRELIEKEACFAFYATKIAQKLLDMVEPKLLLVECGYAPSHMVVQYLAKKRGIPVLEIQHGLISERSVGYFFLKSRSLNLQDSPFPDKICVYGPYFKGLLLNNPNLREEDVPVVGYPYLWMQYNKWIQHAKEPSKRNRILITSQPGLGEFWADFAVELAEKLRRPILIKPHPAEADHAQRIFKRALRHPMVAVAQDGMSLYELLATASHHLSVSSTSHLEAIAFGAKDIIVARGSLQEQLFPIASRGVPVVNSVEEAAQAINEYPDATEITKYVLEQIFALDLNPLRAIEGVLEQYL